jgi:serine protease inhibitor
MLKQLLSGVLAFGMFLGGGASSDRLSSHTFELTADIPDSSAAVIDIDAPEYQSNNPKEQIAQLGLQLLLQQGDEENLLISPLSVASVLGMTANGADGETLKQMESLLGTDVERLNAYLQSYLAGLDEDKFCQINLANSIWLRNQKGLQVNQDFLQTAHDHYNAQIFRAPFDKTTKQDINHWVKEQTEGAIEHILDKSPQKEDLLYLVNALSFDAKWMEVYEPSQVADDFFTTEAGEEQEAQMMACEEWGYLKTGKASGFSKLYRGGDYAFVALLPDEGVSVQELLQSLRGELLTALLEQEQEVKVKTKLPKFSVQYGNSLCSSLQQLGMQDSFDRNSADFSKMAALPSGEKLFIRDILHRTVMEINEHGTKAAAVTIAMMGEGAALETQEPKEVYLDRPFFYMIVDSRQGLPLFMGTLMTIE